MTGFFKIQIMSDYNVITHEFTRTHDLIVNVDSIATIEAYVNTDMDPEMEKDRYIGLRITGTNNVYVIDGHMYSPDWILEACKNAQYQNLKDALGFKYSRDGHSNYNDVYDLLRTIAND